MCVCVCVCVCVCSCFVFCLFFLAHLPLFVKCASFLPFASFLTSSCSPFVAAKAGRSPTIGVNHSNTTSDQQVADPRITCDTPGRTHQEPADSDAEWDPESSPCVTAYDAARAFLLKVRRFLFLFSQDEPQSSTSLHLCSLGRVLQQTTCAHTHALSLSLLLLYLCVLSIWQCAVTNTPILQRAVTSDVALKVGSWSLNSDSSGTPAHTHTRTHTRTHTHSRALFSLCCEPNHSNG